MRLSAFYIILVLLSACGSHSEQEDPQEDPLLASVYGQQLRFSDIQPLIQTEATREDSIQYTHALIEKWVRDAILMHEAERNIPADLDIQKMVNDYRSSLILMTYKQQLVEEKLDTLITNEQLEAYYAQHKEQFKLDEPILKCTFLKIDKSIDEFDDLDKMWKDDKIEALEQTKEDLFDIKLNSNQWYTWKDINALVPKNFWSYSQLSAKKRESKSSGNFKYYIKVSAFEDKNKIAPLSYIEDQAKKVILHKRQTELLDNLMQDLYDKYASNNNVKINI